MKININIEAIVREEVRNFIRETLIINNVPGDRVEVTINTKRMTNSGEASKWEYGRKNGRRRTTEEIALHTLEKKHGRLLTPEEKGEAKALVQIDETAENKAKEDTIKASKEIAEEEKEELKSGAYPENPMEPEATIPKAEELKTDSLFGTKL